MIYMEYGISKGQEFGHNLGMENRAGCRETGWDRGQIDEVMEKTVKGTGP